jgi:hypothetical protein
MHGDRGDFSGDVWTANQGIDARGDREVTVAATEPGDCRTTPPIAKNKYCLIHVGSLLPLDSINWTRVTCGARFRLPVLGMRIFGVPSH